MKKTFIGALILLLLLGVGQAAVVDDAITWMYDNGFTVFQIAKDYKPTNYIRRDEAAKFFVKFSQILGKTEYKKTANECVFSDINQSYKNLKDIVVESCRMGIFQGANGKFIPGSSITNEQAIALLVRILVGNQIETGVLYRSENYYKKANELKLLKNVFMNERKTSATRGNIAILLATNSDESTGIAPIIVEEFTIAACNKYVRLMRCVAEKSGQGQKALDDIDRAIAARKVLREDQLIQTCDGAIAAIPSNASAYTQLGCWDE